MCRRLIRVFMLPVGTYLITQRTLACGITLLTALLFISGRQVGITMHGFLTLALLTLSWPGSHWNASSQMADDNDADLYLTSVRIWNSNFSGRTHITVVTFTFISRFLWG
jgi:hypothetical protein